MTEPKTLELHSLLQVVQTCDNFAVSSSPEVLATWHLFPTASSPAVGLLRPIVLDQLKLEITGSWTFWTCNGVPKVSFSEIINTPEKERDEGEFYVSEELYREYVSAGERLRKLHLMQIKAPAELALEPNTPDDMEVGAIKYKNGALQLNANKRITGISQEVWKYQIGGHQVLDKWFKEHKDEALTIDSFTHIENIVGALDETIKLREYNRS